MTFLSFVCLMRVGYLNFGQDGHDGGSDTQQHVDADESLVLGAAVGVGVVHVEQHQRHEGQGVVQGRGGKKSYGAQRRKCITSTAMFFN